MAHEKSLAGINAGSPAVLVPVPEMATPASAGALDGTRQSGPEDGRFGNQEDSGNDTHEH